MIELRSTITCPACGHQATEAMPTDFCQYFYDCNGCGVQMKPNPGDCCVFCSYGSVPCPPSSRRDKEGRLALVVVQVPMDEECASDSPTRANDWSGEWRTLAGLWGVPAVAMLIAALLEPMLRAGIWSTMLAWMGVACVLNARRCSRTHCRFTGPFLLLMAGLVIAHATGVLSLGADGWTLLGGTTIVGFAALWWGSERIWGAFLPRHRKAGRCRN